MDDILLTPLSNHLPSLYLHTGGRGGGMLFSEVCDDKLKPSTVYGDALWLNPPDDVVRNKEDGGIITLHIVSIGTHQSFDVQASIFDPIWQLKERISQVDGTPSSYQRLVFKTNPIGETGEGDEETLLSHGIHDQDEINLVLRLGGGKCDSSIANFVLGYWPKAQEREVKLTANTRICFHQSIKGLNQAMADRFIEVKCVLIL